MLVPSGDTPKANSGPSKSFSAAKTALLPISHTYSFPSSDPERMQSLLLRALRKAGKQQYLMFWCPVNVLTHRPVWWDHRRTALSRDPARMYLPFGENLALVTGGLSLSTSVFRHLPLFVSHSLLNTLQ